VTEATFGEKLPVKAAADCLSDQVADDGWHDQRMVGFG